MTEHLLVVGVGGGMERSLVDIAGMGIEMTVVTDGPAPKNEGIRKVISAYPRSWAGVTSALRAASIDRPSGILSLGYENPPVVSRLSDFYDLPGASLKQAELVTYKHQRSRRLSEHGVRVPPFRVAEDRLTAQAVLATLGLPAVVKPVDMTSSIGVSVVHDASVAEFAIDLAFQSSPSGTVIVESYIDGDEFTVEGFVQSGQVVITGSSCRNYSEKLRFAPAVFENGDTLPDGLSDSERSELWRLAEEACIALEIDDSVVHFDILRSAADRGFLILEVALRMSGARFGTELVPLSTGVSILKPAVDLALGRPTRADEPAQRLNAVVSRYLPADGQRIVDCPRLPPPDTLSGVYDVFLERVIQGGERLGAFRNGKDIVAGVIAVGDSIEAAEDSAAEALDLTSRMLFVQ